MIPDRTGWADADEEQTESSLTYYIDRDKQKLDGDTDGAGAVRQAVYLILNTERYDYPIYSHNYGAQLKNLAGQPISYVLPELRRLISEALEQDDRIESVDGFSFETSRGQITVHFTVHSVFGTLEESKEVEI